MVWPPVGSGALHRSSLAGRFVYGARGRETRKRKQTPFQGMGRLHSSVTRGSLRLDPENAPGHVDGLSPRAPRRSGSRGCGLAGGECGAGAACPLSPQPSPETSPPRSLPGRRVLSRQGPGPGLAPGRRDGEWHTPLLAVNTSTGGPTCPEGRVGGGRLARSGGGHSGGEAPRIRTQVPGRGGRSWGVVSPALPPSCTAPSALLEK